MYPRELEIKGYTLKAGSYDQIDFPANMYIWDPYGQNLGIYPIRVLHGPHIGFFVHIRPI